MAVEQADVPSLHRSGCRNMKAREKFTWESGPTSQHRQPIYHRGEERQPGSETRPCNREQGGNSARSPFWIVTAVNLMPTFTSSPPSKRSLTRFSAFVKRTIAVQ